MEQRDDTKAFTEWYLQADYDYETAEAMLKSGRYIYTIYMCHLSVEKALKGLLLKKTNGFPPKTHNLLYLVDKMQLQLSEESFNFVFMLNKVSIPARYPEDLKKLMIIYTKSTTYQILEKTKALLKWIKEQ